MRTSVGTGKLRLARRLMPLCVAIAVVLCSLSGAAGSASAPASVTVVRDALDYPFFNQSGFPGNDPAGVMATCVTGKESDCENPNGAYALHWGYESKCPQIDTGCMRTGLTVKVNGHTWGMSDPWGYALRNCTSYVAWKLASLGVSPAEFEGLGNGGQWYSNSPKSRRTTKPAYGDAAVQPPTKSNPYGHVAFVESVNGNLSDGGTITVSEYNDAQYGAGDERTGTPAQLGFTEFVTFGVATATWTMAEASVPGGSTNATAALWSVACPSAASCVAAGSYFTAGAGRLPLLLTGSGSSWQPATVKLPAAATPGGYANVNLFAVACGSASRCVAVGSYTNLSGVAQALLISGSGSSWTAVVAPQPAGALGGGLTHVVCPSATQCVAVGGYTDASGHAQGLLLTGYGSAWTLAKAPLPTGAGGDPGVSLGGVACPSASACVVAGRYRDSSAHGQGLLLTGYGSAWTATRAPVPSGAAANPGAGLDAVACPSTTACAAVGGYDDSSGHGQGLLLTGYGSTWTATRAPLPSGAAANPFASLGALTCPAVSACMAAGTYASSSGNQQALLLTGSGSSWTPATLTQSPVYQNSPYDMACVAATQCLAAAYDLEPSGQGLLAAGGGASWTASDVPAPSNAAAQDPAPTAAALSCPTASECVIVGSYRDSSGTGRGLLLTVTATIS
jgi:surface antigen